MSSKAAALRDLQQTVSVGLVDHVNCAPLWARRTRSANDDGVRLMPDVDKQLRQMRGEWRTGPQCSASDQPTLEEIEHDWNESDGESSDSDNPETPTVMRAIHPGAAIRHSRSSAEKQADWDRAYAKADKHKMVEFLRETQKITHVESHAKPAPADTAVYSARLHEYFAQSAKPYSKPIEQASGRLLAALRKQWGRRGTVKYRGYPDRVVCEFCGRRTHLRKHCETRPILSDLNHAQTEFVQFIKKYYKEHGRQVWLPTAGTQEERAANLPLVWERLQKTANEIEREWNKPVPVPRHEQKRYPWRGAGRAVWLKYAMGFPENLLLIEVLGSRSRWFQKPRRLQFPNAPSTATPQATAAIDADVLHGTENGLYVPIPRSYAKLILGLSYVEPTATKKERVVISGEYPNFFEPKYRYRLPTVFDFAQFAEVGDFVGAVDFAKAFKSRPVHKEEALYQCFEWKGVVYAILSDHFGRCNAPFRFQRFVKRIGKFLCAAGIFSLFYLDDGIHLLSEISEARLVQQQFLVKLWNGLCLPMNPSTCDIRNATQKHKWIGFMIDTRTMRVTLPQKKEKRILELLGSLSKKDKTSCKTLASLKGQLQAARFAVESIHLLITSIKDSLAAALRWATAEEIDAWSDTYLVVIDTATRAEIVFLRQWLPTLNGCALHRERWDVDLFVDASDAIAAGYTSAHTCHTVMPDGVRKESSTFRELYGALSATHAQIKKWKNKTVRITTDSLSTTFIMTFGRVRKAHISYLAQAFALLCLEHKVKVFWQWQRRETAGIVLADAMSKSASFSDWSLSSTVLSNVCRAMNWPPVSIDLCASPQNRQCDRYVSRSWDGESTYVDCLDTATLSAIDWRAEFAYANPPYERGFIRQFLTSLRHHKARILVCIPVWEAQPFWQVVQTSARCIIFLPRNKLLFTCAEFFGKDPKVPSWTACLALLDFSEVVTSCDELDYDWVSGATTPRTKGSQDSGASPGGPAQKRSRSAADGATESVVARKRRRRAKRGDNELGGLRQLTDEEMGERGARLDGAGHRNEEGDAGV